MSGNNIKVAVRIRPQLPQEEDQALAASDSPLVHRQIPSIFQVLPDNQLVIKPVVNSTSEIKSFSFDYVFDETAHQPQIFEEAVKPLVDGFLRGTSASVLAYGQTGSGKTYSMGISKELLSITADESGIVPRAIAHMFDCLRTKYQSQCESAYEITASFLELYNEDLIDLLDKTVSKLPRPKPQIREENGVLFVSNIIEEKCESPEAVIQILGKGSSGRTTAATEMNDTSSRSHAIFTVTLKIKEPTRVGGVLTTTSKFFFVDLAGSERLKKTNSEGDRKKEGISINQGLLALGNVISALGDESKKSQTHIPYRDSKLTRLLQESLGGNSQTLMISCVSPIMANHSETLSTLVYANRTRNIKNKIVINQEWDGGVSNQKEIKSLQENAVKLQSLLSTAEASLQESASINTALQLRVQAEEEKMVSLNSDIERLSIERSQALQSVETLSKQLQEAEFTLANQSDKLDASSQLLDSLRNKVKDLEEQLVTTSRLQQVHLKRLEELSSEKAQIWMEKSSISTKLSDLVREKGALEKSLESLVLESQKKGLLLESVAKEKDELAQSLQKTTEDISRMERDTAARIASLDAALLQSLSSVTSLSDDLADQLVKAIMWKSEHEFAIEELAKKNDALERMSGTLGALKGELEERNQLVNGQIGRIDSLEGELESYFGEIQTLKLQVQEKDGEINSITATFTTEAAMKDALNKSLQKDISAAVQERDDFRGCVETLQSLVAKKDKELADRKEQLQKAGARLAESSEKLSESTATIQSLEQDVAKQMSIFHSDKALLEEKLAVEVSEKNSILSEYCDLKAKMQDMEKEVLALKEQVLAKKQSDLKTDLVEPVDLNEKPVASKSKKRKSAVYIVEERDAVENQANLIEYAVKETTTVTNDENREEPPVKKVNLRKKKADSGKLDLKVAKKTGGVLSSIAVLMSNGSRTNSPRGVKTRSRAKAKDSEITAKVSDVKPKMPLKYLMQLQSGDDN